MTLLSILKAKLISGRPKFHFHTNILLHQRICLRFNRRYSLHDSQAKDNSYMCVIRMGTHFLFHCFPIEQNELSLLLQIQWWSLTHMMCVKKCLNSGNVFFFTLFTFPVTLCRYCDVTTNWCLHFQSILCTALQTKNSVRFTKDVSRCLTPCLHNKSLKNISNCLCHNSQYIQPPKAYLCHSVPDSPKSLDWERISSNHGP